MTPIDTNDETAKLLESIMQQKMKAWLDRPRLSADEIIGRLVEGKYITKLGRKDASIFVINPAHRPFEDELRKNYVTLGKTIDQKSTVEEPELKNLIARNPEALRYFMKGEELRGHEAVERLRTMPKGTPHLKMYSSGTALFSTRNLLMKDALKALSVTPVYDRDGLQVVNETELWDADKNTPRILRTLVKGDTSLRQQDVMERLLAPEPGYLKPERELNAQTLDHGGGAEGTGRFHMAQGTRIFHGMLRNAPQGGACEEAASAARACGRYTGA